MPCCALDNPRPNYDYDCVGNTIAYDCYPENDYAVNARRNDGHAGIGYYDDDYVYAT